MIRSSPAESAAGVRIRALQRREPCTHLVIDAGNIRAGGGITYLARMLAAAAPEANCIERVTVWSGAATLEQMPARPWLELRSHPLLDAAFPGWVVWQQTVLRRELQEGRDLLFVPGGVSIGAFRPLVSMSQNLLPFDRTEIARFSAHRRIRMHLLRRLQRATFRAADGMIFLTPSARDAVLGVTGQLRGRSTVVPHGACLDNPAGFRSPADISTFNPHRPFRWLYLSAIDVYKHQDQVARAAARLRAEGWPVGLDLVGPAHPPTLLRLQTTLRTLDPAGEFLHYHGAVEPQHVEACYDRADAFIFASTCETFGIVLLDAMAAGLPIAATAHGAIRDVLGAAGAYFDSPDPALIAATMRSLMKDREHREALARAAWLRAREFTWEACARETFRFLASIAQPSAGSHTLSVAAEARHAGARE